MATISENLQILKDSTDAIKQAIIDKGGNIQGDITTWADAISVIETGGGSSGGAGSVFKITNKLNGQLFGGPTYCSDGQELLHTYNFSGGVLAGITLLPISEDDGNPFPNGQIHHGYYSDSSQVVHAYPTTYCGCVNIYITNSDLFGGFGISSTGLASVKPLKCLVIVVDLLGNYDIDTISLQGGGPCFVKDTKISLSDNTYKLVQDITYNDELLVWNFDEAKYDTAKPLWIKKEQIETYYYKVVLSNGDIFKCTGPQGHRMFNITKQSFEYPMNCVNDEIYTVNGIVKVLSCEKIEETVEYYNIITDYHINCFADGILTSCRYNNLYPIEGMRFVKDDRMNRAPKWKLYEPFREHKCLGRYIEGLRLYEQIDIPLEDTVAYCERLESLRKTLDEFEINSSVIKNIEDTEVGWIDRDGNSYGFKLYMPGQNNHIILADKICKELNIDTNNPSRYLEKEGWVKYTTDFVLNSDDKEINDKQLKTLHKFLKVPNKLKKDGKIRIGDFMSPHVDISEFDTMDKYSFEYRKKHNRRR